MEDSRKTLFINFKWVALGGILVSLAILAVLPLIKQRLTVLKVGSPIEVLDVFPSENGTFLYNLDQLKFWENETEVFEERETYALWGWAFLDDEIWRDQTFLHQIVLIDKNDRGFVYQTNLYSRSDVADFFKEKGLSNLERAGFYAVIDRNSLEVGDYRIGLLLINEITGEKYFKITNSYIERSPNHLKLNLLSGK